MNLFWARLMGFGIVEPFDEFDLARLDPKHFPAGWQLQASHPELLEELATDFRDEWIQPAALARHDLQVQRLSALGALRRRVEGLLHQILRPQIRAHAGRRRAA